MCVYDLWLARKSQIVICCNFFHIHFQIPQKEAQTFQCRSAFGFNLLPFFPFLAGSFVIRDFKNSLLWGLSFEQPQLYAGLQMAQHRALGEAHQPQPPHSRVSASECEGPFLWLSIALFFQFGREECFCLSKKVNICRGRGFLFVFFFFLEKTLKTVLKTAKFLTVEMPTRSGCWLLTILFFSQLYT